VGEEDFKDLYVRLAGQIFSFAALRLSADQAKDVVNCTFEVVWKKRYAGPAEPSEWPAWIFGIAKNQILQELQRVRRKHHDNRFIAEYSRQLDASGSPDIADAVALTDVGRRIWSHLTPAERDLLNIAFLRALDNQQAAELLGITTTAYTTRVSRLRRRIADLQSSENELTTAETGATHD
jgi:RNA polymerase sigma-70 factor (ECF subfamily)